MPETPGGRGSDWSLNHRNDFPAQRLDALASAGHHRHDGNTQSRGEFTAIDLMAVFLRDIHHVQDNDAGTTQLDDLGGVVEVSFEIRSIHHDDHEFEWRNVAEPVEQNVAGDLFIERIRTETVSAGQVEHGDGNTRRRAPQAAFLAFDV